VDAGFDDGRLAEGYALLLEHVEQLEEGFVPEALSRLNPQFTGTAAESYQLGQELYLHVVAEGRLYRTYPDFLKSVLAGALPRPGFWLQGGLTESDAETAVLRDNKVALNQEEAAGLIDAVIHSHEPDNLHYVTRLLKAGKDPRRILDVMQIALPAQLKWLLGPAEIFGIQTSNSNVTISAVRRRAASGAMMPVRMATAAPKRPRVVT
jgi:hypothetical protein